MAKKKQSESALLPYGRHLPRFFTDTHHIDNAIDGPLRVHCVTCALLKSPRWI